LTFFVSQVNPESLKQLSYLAMRTKSLNGKSISKSTKLDMDNVVYALASCMSCYARSEE
jgi:hypothetical protein